MGKIRRLWTSNRAANVGLAVLAIITTGLVGFALTTDSVSSAQVAARSQPLPTITVTTTASAHLRVAYLGDSFTTGNNFGGIGAQGWPGIMAAKYGWTPHIAAVGGSGFINEGIGGGHTYTTRVDDVVASTPDLVIIEGGANDVFFSEANELAAATAVLRSLREQLPKAKIVLVGPVWTKQQAGPGLVGVHSAFKAAAIDTGVMWVDATGWFDGRANLIASDGAHPTDEGHAYLAVKIEAALQRLHVT